MSWPLASEFQTILQNPKIAFRDPYLRSCTIEKNPLGQPRAWAGSFAVVYKAVDPDGVRRAVRVFSTESPHRRGRYELIGQYLSSRRLPCLVSFEYREEEIRSLSDGKRYPVVLMDWVEGETLFQWLQAQCRSCNAEAIATAAGLWPGVVGELSQEQIAHGDLHHANILVTTGGEMKLVDYDGMCVPALVGAGCLEVGTPPYQHPQRNAVLNLSLRLDDFSALVIHVALQALAADPTLWVKYVDRTQHDQLLFRVDDFRYPQQSALRRDLMHSSESHVRDMTERLFAAAAGGMDGVPIFCELVKAAPPRPLPGPSRLPGAARPPSSAPRIPQVRPATAGAAVRRPGPAAPANTVPKIRGYEVVAIIGQGPFGSVHLARSEAKGQQVALKIMPFQTQAAEPARRRFLAEVNRAVGVRHPNIASLLTCGAVDKAFYFVSDYCDGGNLADWIKRNGGRLGIGDVQPVMSQCLDGLRHAHLHHLVHGNLSPQNILFSRSSNSVVARLSDLAIGRRFAERFAGSRTGLSGQGKAGFMPPEQCVGDQGVTSQSDLWSMAALIYHALTGDYPWDFGSRDPLDVISTSTPVPIRERDGSIPQAVAEVIDRALLRTPARRFRSAAEMKTAWDNACKLVL